MKKCPAYLAERCAEWEGDGGAVIECVTEIFSCVSYLTSNKCLCVYNKTVFLKCTKIGVDVHYGEL